MDDEIDLTENRIFSPNNRVTIRDFNRILLTPGSFMPKDIWGMIKYTYIKDIDKGLLNTGFKEEYIAYKFYSSFSDGITCDCCGTPIITIPWKKETFGICERCYNHSYIKPKIIWSF